MKDPQTYEDREAEFVKALNKLTKKYGVAIGGCGCCGSPYLHETNAKEGEYLLSGGDDLRWVEKT
jgi:Fe-S oxidoreductase